MADHSTNFPDPHPNGRFREKARGGASHAGFPGKVRESGAGGRTGRGGERMEIEDRRFRCGAWRVARVAPETAICLPGSGSVTGEGPGSWRLVGNGGRSANDQVAKFTGVFVAGLDRDSPSG